jgi:hypothetical protein
MFARGTGARRWLRSHGSQPLLAHEKRFPRATLRRLDVWPRGVTPRGMSGEGATPPVVRRQTRLLVENLFRSTTAAVAKWIC